MLLDSFLQKKSHHDDVDRSIISMSAKEERGSISSLAPDPRKQEIMSDNSDKDKVGQKIAPIT